MKGKCENCKKGIIGGVLDIHELAKAKTRIYKDAKVVDLCSIECRKEFENKKGIKLTSSEEYLLKGE